jgi:metal-sulfur cluster biosynthetic enzyme
MTPMAGGLIERVREAMRVVIDPELGYSVVDLGFIYDVTIDDGFARVTMTTTTSGCPAATILKEGVAASVLTVTGVNSVEVVLTFDPPWTPAMMSSAAKSALGFAEIH